MKLTIVYHPASEHSRKVEEYVHDLEKSLHTKVELLSLESVDGADKARVYDVLRYPAILVTRDDGQLMKSWEGDMLPLMSEVISYM